MCRMPRGASYTTLTAFQHVLQQTAEKREGQSAAREGYGPSWPCLLTLGVSLLFLLFLDYFFLLTVLGAFCWWKVICDHYTHNHELNANEDCCRRRAGGQKDAVEGSTLLNPLFPHHLSAYWPIFKGDQDTKPLFFMRCGEVYLPRLGPPIKVSVLAFIF